MSGLLSELTSLPNLHPALVHFPIALAAAALAIDGLTLILRIRERMDLAIALLYSMAALGGIGTYLTGRQAADSVGQIKAAAEPVLAEHADLALLAMIALILAAVLRAAPRADAARVMMLAPGTHFEAVHPDPQNGWREGIVQDDPETVSYSGPEGWVHMDFLCWTVP